MIIQGRLGAGSSITVAVAWKLLLLIFFSNNTPTFKNMEFFIPYACSLDSNVDLWFLLEGGCSFQKYDRWLWRTVSGSWKSDRTGGGGSWFNFRGIESAELKNQSILSLLVPRTEHHLSSFKCGFLNIFSRQNLLRSLSRLLFLLRWNKYGVKISEIHTPFDVCRKAFEKPPFFPKELSVDERSVGEYLQIETKEFRSLLSKAWYIFLIYNAS